MPKKSRRVASRQAQLSGRSKRVRTHGPGGIPATNPPTPAPAPRPQSWSPAEARPSSKTAPETPRPTSATAPRARGRIVQLRPAESYFVPELRRIGVTTAVIFAVLVILVFVLR